MLRRFFLAVCFLVLFPCFALADFYRWIDNNGNEFFTNDPKQIPQEYREGAAIVKPDERRVSISAEPDTRHHPNAPVAGHKDKYGRGEQYWRQKAANIRLKLRQQQNEYDQVIRQMEDLEQKSGKQTGNRKKSLSRLEKKKIKLEKDIAESRMMLDVDLPEDARRADAYPGWLRE